MRYYLSLLIIGSFIAVTLVCSAYLYFISTPGNHLISVLDNKFSLEDLYKQSISEMQSEIDFYKKKNEFIQASLDNLKSSLSEKSLVLNDNFSGLMFFFLKIVIACLMIIGVLVTYIYYNNKKIDKTIFFLNKQEDIYNNMLKNTLCDLKKEFEKHNNDLNELCCKLVDLKENLKLGRENCVNWISERNAQVLVLNNRIKEYNEFRISAVAFTDRVAVAKKKTAETIVKAFVTILKPIQSNLDLLHAHIDTALVKNRFARVCFGKYIRASMRSAKTGLHKGVVESNLNMIDFSSIGVAMLAYYNRELIMLCLENNLLPEFRNFSSQIGVNNLFITDLCIDNVVRDSCVDNSDNSVSRETISDKIALLFIDQNANMTLNSSRISSGSNLSIQ